MDATALPEMIGWQCECHRGQNVCLVCFDQQCPKRGLICVQCEYIQHKAHMTKPIIWLLAQVRRDSQLSQHFVAFATKIDIERGKAQGLLGQISNEKSKVAVQSGVSTYFSAHSKYLEAGRNAYRRIVQGSMSRKQITNYLVNYMLYERQTEEQKQMSNIQLYLKSVLHLTLQKTKQLEKAIIDKVQLPEILEILLSQGQRKLSYTFSQEFKHKSIVITGCTKATQKNNYSTNFAIVQPIVDGGKKKCRGKRTVKFRIDKLMSWISLGVCYLNIIKSANYYFNTGSVGHGAFFMSSNGYTWHHSNNSLNSHSAEWDFFEGEIITVTICPQKKVITFSKEKGSPYQLAFQPIVGDDLYFCVSLSSHDESVSIEA